MVQTVAEPSDWLPDWEQINHAITRQVRKLRAAGGIFRANAPCDLDLTNNPGQLLLHPWGKDIEIRIHRSHEAREPPEILEPLAGERFGFSVVLPVGRLVHLASGTIYYGAEVRLRPRRQPEPSAPVTQPASWVPSLPSLKAGDRSNDHDDDILALEMLTQYTPNLQTLQGYFPIKLPIPASDLPASQTRCAQLAADWARQPGILVHMKGTGAYETKKKRLSKAMRRVLAVNVSV